MLQLVVGWFTIQGLESKWDYNEKIFKFAVRIQKSKLTILSEVRGRGLNLKLRILKVSNIRDYADHTIKLDIK